VARLPYVEPASASQEVRDILERLPRPLNIFKLMAHAETNFRPLLRLGTSILTEQKLGAALRELAILHTARLCGAEYEWTQHVAIATAVGVTDAQVDALAAGRIDAPCFGACEHAVLVAATDLVRGDPMPEAHFTALQQHLSTREIVELVLAVGFYVTLARLMVLAEIDPDPPVGAAILRRPG
jgi:alkylhydroperoxidase family enzyme